MKVISIIVPVYNEEKTIAKILDKLIKQKINGWEKEIIVINDGSTDGTATVLKKYEKEIITLHQKNQGRGKAVRVGINHAKGNAIIFQDADLEYSPEDLPDLLSSLILPDTPVVYGNRMQRNNSKGYFTHYMGNKLITRVANILFNKNLHDIYTGYKLFDAALLKSIDIQSNGFEFEAEITAIILKKDISIKEVPIRYYPRTYKEGKKIFYTDGIIGVWTLLKHRFFVI